MPAIQRMEIEDSSDEDKDEREDMKWEVFLERPKMHTLYSYALSETHNPVINEGPHTVANVAYRYYYENLIKDVNNDVNQWSKFDSLFKELPTPEGVMELIENEAGTKAEHLKLGYLPAYTEFYNNAQKALKNRVDPKAAVLLIWQLENLHPYATYGWKTALNGKPVSSKSSSGKGEKIKIRRSKNKISKSRSKKLFDSGGRMSFKDKKKAREHAFKKLTRIFGNEKSARRYLDLEGGGKK